MTGGGVITLGETMALLSSGHPGPLAQASSLHLSVGGAESNVAIGLRRLGVPVTWVGRVGADSLGDLVIRELVAEGLTMHVIRDSTAPTGLMLKERRTTHHQRIWYYRGNSAGSRLSPADVPSALISDAALLHVTGITPALSVGAADAVRDAVKIARQSGTLVSLDLNYREALWPPQEAGPRLLELASQADIVFAGEDEAALIVGPGDTSDLATRLGALGPREVIIKRGARGCLAKIGGREFQQAAVPVTVLDSVGAGDAFVAGYLAERLAGRSIESRLRTAARAGAFACLVAGDWEGGPRRDELDLLEKDEPVSR